MALERIESSNQRTGYSITLILVLDLRDNLLVVINTPPRCLTAIAVQLTKKLMLTNTLSITITGVLRSTAESYYPPCHSRTDAASFEVEQLTR